MDRLELALGSTGGALESFDDLIPKQSLVPSEGSDHAASRDTVNLAAAPGRRR
jgi:hypothetical protein